ncbi:MAG: diphthine--ammonia ligase [Limisphaerales bacterium]
MAGSRANRFNRRLTMKEKIVFCWSGGKDSALALNRILRDDRYEIVSLLTTCNEHFQRVSMHGVRLELLNKQAEAIGLPLEKIFMSRRSSNDEYQQKMSACLLAHKSRGVSACVFGDIFLEDLKRWREENLAKVGMRGIFPIWKNDSRELIREFIALDFGTVICCVNDAYLGEDSVGRNIDEEFIRALPANVDPCGENGEFHSFAFAGPVFKQPLKFKLGDKVYRPVEVTHPSDSTTSYVCPSSPRQTKGFWFCDLLPD